MTNHQPTITTSKKALLPVSLFLAFLLLVSSPIFSQAEMSRSTPPTIEELVAQFPAPDPAVRDRLVDALLKRAPDSIHTVCRMIAPPGKTNDTAAQFAVNGMVIFLQNNRGEKERESFCRILIEELNRSREREVKAFFIRQLQLIGQEETVKALRPYLTDATLYDPAAQAMRTISGREAEKALLAALKTSRGSVRITLIKTLGEMQSRAAVRMIEKDARSDDPILRQTALFALAGIGAPSSKDTLSRTRLNAPFQERSRAPSLLLLFARRMAENGFRKQSLDLCRDLIQNYDNQEENHIAAQALSLVWEIEQDRAAADLLDAVDSPHAGLRSQALRLAGLSAVRAMTGEWIQKAKQVPPHVRAEIITMLSRSGDPAAVEYIRGLLHAEEPVVQMAAVPALVHLDRTESLPELLSLLQTADERLLSVLKESFLLYSSDSIVPEAVSRMADSSGPVKTVLLGILADKGAVEHRNLFYIHADQKDAEVRTAALEGLARISQPEDIPLLFLLFQPERPAREKVALQNALLHAISSIENIENKSTPFIREILSAEGKRRADLLRLLSDIGGASALQTVLTELTSEDSTVKNAAVVTLSRWPTMDAADPLLELIKETENDKFAYLAVQGYVRLLRRADIPEVTKIEQMEFMLSLPLDSSAKKLVLRGLGSFPGPQALELILPYLKDEQMKTDAASAAASSLERRYAETQELPRIQDILLLREAAWLVADEQEQHRISEIARNFLDRLSFSPLFNGNNLDGWKGLVKDPPARAKMTKFDLDEAQEEADTDMRAHWTITDGVLLFDGKGHSLCTAEDYGDFEMFVDWKIQSEGDSGIYLRGSPQVQIWDTAQWPEGSGGLYNNKNNPAKPLAVADHPIGEWNTFYIKMVNDHVTVYLNNVLVVDNVVMENYWERDKLLYSLGQIELQAHSTPLQFRNLFIRTMEREEDFSRDTEREQAEGFKPLFNGKDLTGWTGDTMGYAAEKGEIVIHPDRGVGNLYTEKEYGDLRPYQYHGSIYGVVPAKRGYLRPVGEWNSQEVTVEGNRVKVRLNGIPLIDADIEAASRDGTIDGRNHPGLLNKKGHLGFLGHGSVVRFRNIRLRELN
ncbi:MAG: DUF1080 domain-containing protein [Acidobacteria bacterium]|nr:DUF1080 domain-containing protein [Acidobacteriota bacterium]